MSIEPILVYFSNSVLETLDSSLRKLLDDQVIISTGEIICAAILVFAGEQEARRELQVEYLQGLLDYENHPVVTHLNASNSSKGFKRLPTAYGGVAGDRIGFVGFPWEVAAYIQTIVQAMSAAHVPVRGT